MRLWLSLRTATWIVAKVSAEIDFLGGSPTHGDCL